MTQITPATPQSISYPLHTQGYIHNWLVAGPQAIAVDDLTTFEHVDRASLAQAVAAAYHQPVHPVTQPPMELAPLLIGGQQGETKLTWRAVQCRDDHLVDYTNFYDTCHYLRTWAYTELVASSPQMATFVLTTNGPVAVWLNGELVQQDTDFYPTMGSVTFDATLRAGQNTVLVCFTNVALHDCPYALALQVTAPDAAGLTVQIPTTLRADRRQKLEQIFAAAYLDRDLYHRDDEVVVRWPQDLQLSDQIGVRLQTPTGRIYAEGQPMIKSGAAVKLGKAYQRADGVYWVTLMPTPEEYYVHGMRVVRHLPLRIANSKFTETPYGTYAERRREALADAVQQAANVYSEIAKMALGWWDKLKPAVFVNTLARVNGRIDGSDVYLLGLLGALARYGDDPAFPVELKTQLTQCALNFPYWPDKDDPAVASISYHTESHQILFHACEVLAGQLFPDHHFAHAGQTGEWHRANGTARALAWLRQRAQDGFQAWDSPIIFEQMLLALTHLTDLAENGELVEMSAVVLDKLCFTIALNSWRGIFGSTQGMAIADSLKGGRLAATVGVGRLLWGVGAFTEHILGTVSLACAPSYELPPPLYEIGATPVEALWSRERHAGLLTLLSDGATGAWEINKVTYKTPDYMLCAAQDYRAGQPGAREHIWQATLGLDAVVFVNHPACMSQAEAHQPNFWRGNARLPRVAQWKDVLIALHDLPADAWLNFTHAYFPTVHFDEYVLHDGWAFARKGEGYLALTASGGLTLTTTGEGAYGELRSAGAQTAWFCHMGRAAVDGTFHDFQTSILALDITLAPLAVHATTLRGESIDFGWTGPLLVNETEQPLQHANHYDSPFCVSALGADVMEIRAWQQAMQLDFRQYSADDAA